ncbi:hypothetical protein ASD52_30055 [Ensifer sp. Root142]|nr:hypothetical protein ASD52_30055 [Ensifer sp. Root142]
MWIWEPMPFGQSGKDLVLFGNERSSLKNIGLMLRCFAVRQHKQRQGLVLVSHQSNDGRSRTRPRNPFNINLSRSLHEGTMPTVKLLARIGGIFETWSKQKQSVFFHQFNSSMPVLWL